MGNTGIIVSEIGFGAWAIGGSSYIWGYGSTDDQISKRTVHEALDMGCNLFDTADCYGEGHSERILGSILSSRRAEICIVTKAGFDFYRQPTCVNFHPAYIRFAIHQSLKRLKTDYIDIFLLHNPPVPVMFDPGVIEVLAKSREMGIIRAAGVSAATIPDAVEALQAGWPQVIQVPYNMLAQDAGIYVIPQAKATGIGIIAREPLANGFLTGKFDSQLPSFPLGDIRSLWPTDQVRHIIRQTHSFAVYRRENETFAQLALRFVLDSPGVSCVICGCKSPQQAKENFSAIKNSTK
jgi:aryl-alcohol dehydrogenase-like predicted oxidoreductase